MSTITEKDQKWLDKNFDVSDKVGSIIFYQPKPHYAKHLAKLRQKTIKK